MFLMLLFFFLFVFLFIDDSKLYTFDLVETGLVSDLHLKVSNFDCLHFCCWWVWGVGLFCLGVFVCVF